MTDGPIDFFSIKGLMDWGSIWQTDYGKDWVPQTDIKKGSRGPKKGPIDWFPINSKGLDQGSDKPSIKKGTVQTDFQKGSDRPS